MLEALGWWATLQLLGLLALPYLFWCFRRLPDHGFGFSKVAGTLLLGYLLWVTATLGIAPNGRGAAALVLLVLGLGALLLARRYYARLSVFMRRERALLLVYEGVFLAAFLGWAFVRAHNPEIDGTEKPMNFALLNTAVRSTGYPPADPWLSGHTVNYYYFGYVLVAGLVHVTGQATAVAYNLGLASVFAAVVAGGFAIGANLARLHWASRRQSSPARGVCLRRLVLYGTLCSAFLVGLGNLEGALEVYRWHGGGTVAFWDALAIKGEGDGSGKVQLLGPVSDPGGVEDSWYPTAVWWWWRATRVIDTVVDGASLDYTITEFPFFSFLLGDLHPHVLALPLALLALALVLELTIARPRGFLRWIRVWPWTMLPAVLVLGSLGFTNGWDLLPYLALYLAAGLMLAIRHGSWRALLSYGVWATAIGCSAILVYAPFYLPLAAQVLFPGSAGIEVAGGRGLPVLWWSGPGTRPLHFLLLWAPFVACTVVFLVVVASRRSARSALMAILSLAAVALVWAVLEARLTVEHVTPGPATVLHRVWPLVPFGLSAWMLGLNLRSGRFSPGLVFALLLAAAAFLLFAVSESLYIRDVFGTRMNTVFKLSYQAWVLLAIASAFSLCYTTRPLAGPARVAIGVLVALACVYPVAALPAKTGGFQGAGTLDGLDFLRRSQPGEVEAQTWLGTHASRSGSVVLEATGGQYSRFGRVSTHTGVPTVLGWAGHEVQWRGGDHLFRGRPEDIDRMYLSLDKTEVVPLLQAYGVDYVYVGDLERSKYPAESLDAFSRVMDIAFENRDVTIYAAAHGGGLRGR